MQLFSVPGRRLLDAATIANDSTDTVNDVSVIPKTPYVIIGCESGNCKIVLVASRTGTLGGGIDQGLDPAASLAVQPYQILGEEVEGRGGVVAVAVTRNADRPLALIVHRNSGAVVWDIRAERVIAAAVDDEDDPSKPTCACWVGDRSNCFAIGYDDGSILMWGVAAAALSKGHVASTRVGGKVAEPCVLVMSLRVGNSGGGGGGGGEGSSGPVRSLTFLPGGESTPGGEDCLLVCGGQPREDPDMLTLLPLDPENAIEQKMVPWFGTLKAHALMMSAGSSNGSGSDSSSSSATVEGLIVLTEGGQLVVHDLLDWHPTPLTLPLQELPPITVSKFVPTVSRDQAAALTGQGPPGGVQHALTLTALRALRNGGTGSTSISTNASQAKHGDWPFTGGEAGRVGDEAVGGGCHPSALLMTGHRDGKVRVWDSTTQVPSLLCVVPSSSSVLGSTSDTVERLRPVSAMDVCPASGLLTVGHVGGDVRMYQFSDRPESVRKVILDESLVPYDTLCAQGPGFQFVLKYGMHAHDITAVCLASRMRLLAVGDGAGVVSGVDLTAPQVLFKTVPVVGTGSSTGNNVPVAKLAIGPTLMTSSPANALETEEQQYISTSTTPGAPSSPANDDLYVFVASADSSLTMISIHSGEAASRTLRPKNASKPLDLVLLDAQGIPLSAPQGSVFLPWADNNSSTTARSMHMMSASGLSMGGRRRHTSGGGGGGELGTEPPVVVGGSGRRRMSTSSLQVRALEEEEDEDEGGDRADSENEEELDAALAAAVKSSSATKKGGGGRKRGSRFSLQFFTQQNRKNGDGESGGGGDEDSATSAMPLPSPLPVQQQQQQQSSPALYQASPGQASQQSQEDDEYGIPKVDPTTDLWGQKNTQYLHPTATTRPPHTPHPTIDYPYVDWGVQGHHPPPVQYVLITTTEYLRVYSVHSVRIGDRTTEKKARFDAPVVFSATFLSEWGPGIISISAPPPPLDNATTNTSTSSVYVHSVPNLALLASTPLSDRQALGFPWRPLDESSSTAGTAWAVALEGQVVLTAPGNEMVRMGVVGDTLWPVGAASTFDWELARAAKMGTGGAAAANTNTNTNTDASATTTATTEGGGGDGDSRQPMSPSSAGQRLLTTVKTAATAATGAVMQAAGVLPPRDLPTLRALFETPIDSLEMGEGEREGGGDGTAFQPDHVKAVGVVPARGGEDDGEGATTPGGGGGDGNKVVAVGAAAAVATMAAAGKAKDKAKDLASAAFAGAATGGAKLKSMLPIGNKRGDEEEVDANEAARRVEVAQRERRQELLGSGGTGAMGPSPTPPHTSSSPYTTPGGGRATARSTPTRSAAATANKGRMVKRTASEVKRVYGHTRAQDAKATMERNKALLAERGQKLKNLEEQAAVMRGDAEDFESMAAELEAAFSNRKWWQF